MPTFDFRCSKCGTVFEETVPFGTKKTPVCASCGSKKTEKLFSPPSVVFRGSGFYKTDSGPRPIKGTAKPEKKEATTEKTSDSSTSSPTKETKKTDK